jgi:hypothetical protein
LLELPPDLVTSKASINSAMKEHRDEKGKEQGSCACQAHDRTCAPTGRTGNQRSDEEGEARPSVPVARPV